MRRGPSPLSSWPGSTCSPARSWFARLVDGPRRACPGPVPLALFFKQRRPANGGGLSFSRDVSGRIVLSNLPGHTTRSCRTRVVLGIRRRSLGLHAAIGSVGRAGLRAHTHVVLAFVHHLAVLGGFRLCGPAFHHHGILLGVGRTTFGIAFGIVLHHATFMASGSATLYLGGVSTGIGGTGVAGFVVIGIGSGGRQCKGSCDECSGGLAS